MRVATREHRLVEQPARPSCGTDEPPLLFSVRLAAVDDRGCADVELSRGAGLELAVANSADGDAEVTVRALSWSDAGKGRAAIEIGRLSHRSSSVVEIDPSDLALPSGAVETSGSLLLRVDGLLDDGAVLQSATLALAFHPVEDGFRVYDLETRDSTYGGGALTADARSARAAVLASLPEGTQLAGISYGTSQGVSDSTDWRPPPDGPAESDERGER